LVAKTLKFEKLKCEESIKPVIRNRIKSPQEEGGYLYDRGRNVAMYLLWKAGTNEPIQWLHLMSILHRKK